MIIDAVGSGEAVEAYGKVAVVGLDGEVEHASALIHTLRFGITTALPLAPNPTSLSPIRVGRPIARS